MIPCCGGWSGGHLSIPCDGGACDHGCDGDLVSVSDETCGLSCDDGALVSGGCVRNGHGAPVTEHGAYAPSCALDCAESGGLGCGTSGGGSDPVSGGDLCGCCGGVNGCHVPCDGCCGCGGYDDASHGEHWKHSTHCRLRLCSCSRWSSCRHHGGGGACVGSGDGGWIRGTFGETCGDPSGSDGRCVCVDHYVYGDVLHFCDGPGDDRL